ncbi:MAG TPA: hypothetical protein VM864_08485 [Pyrinomonadaceae bacterium]|jgi:hypothetical protein|nr:hypothetical protein [Pyrinomonadaceae bacterium]
MRSKFAAAGAGLAAFVLFAAVAAAAAKPNYTGTWVLDAAKSEGVGGPQGAPAAEETMTVKQDGDKIAAERKIKGQQGERVVNDSYTADGKEGEFTMQMRGNETKGKRTAKWSADGNVLEVNDKASFDTPQGAMTTESNSKWTLSADGKTLTIEGTRTTPRGEQKFKRVYNKQ